MKVKVLKNFTWNTKAVKAGDVEETEEHIAKSLEAQGYVSIVPQYGGKQERSSQAVLGEEAQ